MMLRRARNWLLIALLLPLVISADWWDRTRNPETQPERGGYD